MRLMKSPMTYVEKCNYVYGRLNKLPYFTPKGVYYHIHLAIDESSEVSRLIYVIKTDIRHNRKIAENIFDVIQRASTELGIKIVTRSGR
jgi:hypothetical protein